MEWRNAEIPPSEETRKATLEKARQTMYSRLLLEAFPSILIILDRELCYVIGTDHLIAESFGFADPQELSGLPLAEIFRQLPDTSFAEQIAANCRAVLENSLPLRYNAVLRFADGREMHLAVSLSPVMDRKAVSQGVLALLDDVTELIESIRTPATENPVSATQNENHQSDEQPEEEVVGSFKVKDARVLLVDDNEINLLVAEELLHSSGLEVVCAASGPDAVREAKDTRFDLIFMDHMMPDMDGVEATAQIRDLGDWNATVPVIALTANDDPGIREFFLENKMSDYLGKPLDVGQLNQKLLRWLPADKILREEPAETSAESEPPPTGSEGAVPFKSELLRQVEQQCPIHVRATLTQIGGSEEVYLSVLHAFLNGAKHTLNVLPIYVEEQRWDDYRIKVHGEKSAMANIGANDLSDMARALELAALSGDHDYIRENTANFCEQLDVLRGQLVEILPVREESIRQTADEEDRRDLLQEAAEIDALVDDLENERALERMEPLLRRSYGDKPDRLLEDIRLAIEDFQYDRASALLHELINSQDGNA
jgi:CheY-like chemotaxis protein/HPt (histidine-containing phosphotransfer) domain-containing protein